MTTGLHRPKQPDLVKRKLLAAGAELLSEGSPLSIGSVADAAGVTKGAVQHHFGTREQLLLAIHDELQGEFEAALAGMGPEVPAAERYVDLTLGMRKGETAKKQWRALLVASVVERAIAAKWARWVQADRKADGRAATRQLIARLASDGLWLSDTLGTYALSARERQDLARGLRELAQAKA